MNCAVLCAWYQALSAIPPAMLLILQHLVPESPKWLLQQQAILERKAGTAALAGLKNSATSIEKQQHGTHNSKDDHGASQHREMVAKILIRLRDPAHDVYAEVDLIAREAREDQQRNAHAVGFIYIIVELK